MKKLINLLGLFVVFISTNNNILASELEDGFDLYAQNYERYGQVNQWQGEYCGEIKLVENKSARVLGTDGLLRPVTLQYQIKDNGVNPYISNIHISKSKWFEQSQVTQFQENDCICVWAFRSNNADRSKERVLTYWEFTREGGTRIENGKEVCDI